MPTSPRQIARYLLKSSANLQLPNGSMCSIDPYAWPSSSLILKFYFWIEMRKLNSSVVSRKMPRNTFLCEISFLRPSRKNLVQVLNRWNTDIQKALNSKRGQLNFSHIQPWPMFWRVMDLKLLRNTVCLLRWKRFVERGGSMVFKLSITKTILSASA